MSSSVIHDVSELLAAERPITLRVGGLDGDALQVSSVHGTEYISRLFKYQLELFTRRSRAVLFDALLGKPAVLTLNPSQGTHRFFTGILTKVVRTGQDSEFAYYRAELRPAVWRLTKTYHCRVFQDETVADILAKVLTGFQVDYNIASQGMNPRNYVVQYRESDWNFAARLMEEEGITYYFSHTDAQHQLCLLNANDRYPTLSNPSRLIYQESDSGGEENRVLSWEKTQHFASGKYSLRDYHFEIPSRVLEGSEDIASAVSIGCGPTPWGPRTAANEVQLGVQQNDAMEVFDYPGGYSKRYDELDQRGNPRGGQMSLLNDDRERTTRLRMEAEESHSIRLAGVSSYPHLTAGFRIELTDHPTDSDAYVLTHVEHSASQSGTFRSGQGGVFKCSNRFTCVPLSMRMYPSDPAVRRPVIGPQTGVVVGSDGREIYTDKYGRVKVQFHWDRYGVKDHRSSCWLRVAQPWAGRGWGHQWIPRVGQEVIIDFLEGDPDQPIVVGSVYNDENRMPYITADDPVEASKQATRNGIRTRSTPKGTASNYNEISFEDSKGHELLNVHAERMLHTTVEASERHTVGVNQTIKIGNNRDLTVGGVAKDGSKHGDIKAKVFKNDNKHVMVDSRSKIEGKSDTHVVGEAVSKYDASYKVDVGQTLHLKGGQHVIIEAGTSLTLICSGAMVKIDASGVTIVGNPMVKLNPAGAVATPPPPIPAPTPPDDPA